MNWKKVAKEKDDGTFAIYGMKKYLSECSNIYPYMNAECINYIVETFLECIDSVDFLTWLKKGNDDGRPIIITREMLQKDFKDLLVVSEDLETIRDLFMYLYDTEMWIDKGVDCLYTTMWNIKYNNRKKLDVITIAREYERLRTLQEYNELKWTEVYDAIEYIKKNGYDIVSDYKCINEDNIDETVETIGERLQEVLLISK